MKLLTTLLAGSALLAMDANAATNHKNINPNAEPIAIQSGERISMARFNKDKNNAVSERKFKTTSKNPNFANDEERVSYTMGVELGENFKQQGVNINPDLVRQGISDALSDREIRLSKEEMDETLKNFQKTLIEKRAEQFKKMTQENQNTGENFLKDNKAKSGVIALPSGLQYRVIKPGNGEQPQKTDSVTVNYEGRLIDGSIFDSSFERGQSATFKVNAVIAGWTEALQLMRPGAEWELFIPSDLAYGERGTGGKIGPNETLIFKVNLISVKKAENKASKNG